MGIEPDIYAGLLPPVPEDPNGGKWPPAEWGFGAGPLEPPAPVTLAPDQALGGLPQGMPELDAGFDEGAFHQAMGGGGFGDAGQLERPGIGQLAPQEAVLAPEQAAPVQPLEPNPLAQPDNVDDTADFSGLAQPDAPDDAPPEAGFVADPELDAEVQRQSALTPEDLAAEAARREFARSSLISSRTLAAAENDERVAKENHDTYKRGLAAAQKESAALKADSDALASQTIDNDHWFESRTTGQQVAAYFSAIVGGLLSAKRGGKNEGLEMMIGAMERDVEAQKANLANKRSALGERRGMVAELYAQNGDAFRSAETVRLAALQNLDTKLAAAAAGLDPRGTAAQRIVVARQGVAQKRAEAEAAAAAQIEDREMERAKFELEQAKVAETRRSNRASEGAASGARKDARTRIALDAAREGLMPDGKGGFKADPNAPKAAAALLSPSDQRAENKLIVRDQVTGAELGKADSDTSAAGAAAAQSAWHSAEQNLKRMRTLRREIGTTVGNRYMRGTDNDARVAEYEALADQTATMLAKADDPTSTVRDAEKEAVIRQRLPMFSTVTGESAEAADARDKAAIATVRGAVKRAMTAAGVKDFDPGSYYDDAPKPAETKAETAARAASLAGRPPLREIRGPATYDPATKTTTPGKNIGETYLIDQAQAMKSSIETLEAQVQKGDPQALKYLQTMAADPKHPGAALAQEALARAGGG